MTMISSRAPLPFLLFSIFFLAQYLSVIFLRLDDLSPLLEHHWQLIDLVALRNSPLSSILYIHTQPPLFNFLIGILSQSSLDLYNSLVVINCLSGALISVIVYVTAESLCRSRLWAVAIASAYAISPCALLYAGYPFYPTLTSVGYALFIYSLFIFDSQRARSVSCAVGAIIYLTLLRSSMSLPHAILFVLIYLSYGGARRFSTKKSLLILVISIAPLVLLQTKNWIMYDFFGSTSWAPLNLLKGVGIPVSPNHFPAPHQVLELYPDTPCTHGYVSIDTDIRKSDGGPNYNSCFFLSFAQQQKSRLLAEYGLAAHLHRIASHLGQYLSSPDRYVYLSNREKIAGYANAYGRAYLEIEPRKNYEIRLSLVLLCALTALLIVLGIRSRFMVYLYFIFIVHLTSYVLTDGDEGKRFVFEIEFIFYIFIAFVIGSLRNIGTPSLKHTK